MKPNFTVSEKVSEKSFSQKKKLPIKLHLYCLVFKTGVKHVYLLQIHLQIWRQVSQM